MLQVVAYNPCRFFGRAKPTAWAVHKRRCSHLAGADSPAAAGLRPPEGYDPRELRGQSLQLVASEYPELRDLVEKGDLVVVRRDPAYQERREDGYQEPLEVFVLGTAHLSRTSVADVQRLVRAVTPQSVVVELCRSRAALMYTSADSSGGGGGEAAGAAAAIDRSPSSGSGSDSEPPSDSSSSPRRVATNPLNLSGPQGLLPAFQRTLELGGRSALLLRLMLGALASRVGGPGAAGASGAEFVAARVAADAVGAQVVLGDRPIEITLRRAWEALTWRRRLQLAGQLVQGVLFERGQVRLDEEAIERLKNDDAVSQLFAQLAAEYPEVMGPLIYERDAYLAWSLKRSKAVNGTQRVVGVVGKGHLRGVCYALTQSSDALRFKDLVGYSGSRGRRAAAAQKLVWQSVAETAALGGLLWAWGVWHGQQ